MCQWYCTSEGPFTNLHCLHCHVRYCGACLHGEAGKMESLVKCASCGRKPRVKPNAQRRGWGHEVASPQGTSKTVLSPPQRGKSAQAYWAYKNAGQQDGQFTWGQQFTRKRKRTIFDKLTDPSLYTGSHKHRFDEEGRGRGLEGRDSVAIGLGTGAAIQYYGDGPVISIAQLVRNEKLDPQHMNKIRQFPDGSTILSPRNRSWKNADTAWRPEITPRGVYPSNNPTYQRHTPGSTPGSARLNYSASSGHLPSSHAIAQFQHTSTSSSRSPPRTPQQHHQQQYQHTQQHHQQQQQQQYAPDQYYQQTQQRQAPAYEPSPIFDKLNDPSQYTGSHKHRFDEQGRGLGLAGRVEVTPDRYQGDSYASSNVTDLSQITRPQYNVGSPSGKTGHKFQY